ncbi:hypothetical protein I2I11_06530 [Pontibacter sp. 172403-2]|uniref:hypothetical protein n=1 Tax=Pontibacter rufus TaxID=2791028 RepID=UPI0018AFB6A6|nr:hypothetical protein [Pontibacter sp. 172403-2]MBF9252940.1 hypothetical protein [Pontibacter sp. 172403-2]
MTKTSTSDLSDLTLLASLFLMVLLYASCTARVDRNAQETAPEQEMPVAAVQKTPVTLAAIEAPADEAYFDLIAKTADCLGENVWIGGKVESADKLALSKTGALRKAKVYRVTELTATGLNTNHSYTFRDQDNALLAIGDNDGHVKLQLRDGALQLSTMPGDAPIVVAFQQTASVGAGSDWSCQ